MGLLNLLGIALEGNILGGLLKKTAITAREDHGQVQLHALYAVILCDFFRGLNLLIMLLSIVDGQGQDVFRANLGYGHGKAGGAVHAAAG